MKRASSRQELNPVHLACAASALPLSCLVVVAQGQRTGCASQVCWVPFLVTASLSPSYFRLKTFNLSLIMLVVTSYTYTYAAAVLQVNIN